MENGELELRDGGKVERVESVVIDTIEIEKFVVNELELSQGEASEASEAGIEDVAATEKLKEPELATPVAPAELEAEEIEDISELKVETGVDVEMLRTDEPELVPSQVGRNEPIGSELEGKVTDAVKPVLNGVESVVEVHT